MSTIGNQDDSWPLRRKDLDRDKLDFYDGGHQRRRRCLFLFVCLFDPGGGVLEKNECLINWIVRFEGPMKFREPRGHLARSAKCSELSKAASPDCWSDWPSCQVLMFLTKMNELIIMAP